MIETVYLAGPYSADPENNTEMALAFADILFNTGFQPFVPHLCHFWDMRYPHSYERWLRYCAAWIPRCDAVLVWGPLETLMSHGTQHDIGVAKQFKIPVFYTTEDLVKASKE